MRQRDLFILFSEECAFLYGDGKCDVQCSASQCGFDGGDCITILEDAQEPIVMEVMTYPMELCVKLRLISAELAQVVKSWFIRFGFSSLVLRYSSNGSYFRQYMLL